MPKIRLDIVTAERVVFSGEVERLTAPGLDGELTVLPRHAPLLTVLQPGELRVRLNGDEVDIAIGGGFAEIEPTRVTVLADTAERAEEIDVARAQAALDRAKGLLASRGQMAESEMRQALAALRRSEVRLKVARRRRQPENQKP